MLSCEVSIGLLIPVKTGFLLYQPRIRPKPWGLGRDCRIYVLGRAGVIRLFMAKFPVYLDKGYTVLIFSGVQKYLQLTYLSRSKEAVTA